MCIKRERERAEDRCPGNVIFSLGNKILPTNAFAVLAVSPQVYNVVYTKLYMLYTKVFIKITPPPSPP